MKWSELKDREIKNIFYQDEFGGIGLHENEKQFHLIEDGNIYFELVDKSLIEILIDNEQGGITITKIEDSFKQKLQENKIKKDNYWNKLSDKTISEIFIFKDSYLETINNKTQQKEVVSTIEIMFKNGVVRPPIIQTINYAC